MPKIAFVHFNRYVTQGSTDFYELSQAVGQLLPGNVHVFVAEENGIDSMPRGSVELHSIPVSTRRVWSAESIHFYREVSRQILTLAPDIVSVTFDRGAALIPLLVRRTTGKASPSFIHHVCSVSFAQSHWRYWLSNLLTRVESRAFDSVTTLSPGISREIYGEGFPRPSTIVPIGVNTRHFRFGAGARAELRARYGCDDSHLVAIYVGTLCATKNCDDLIKAVVESGPDRRNLRLWIVGTGPQKLELERLAYQLGLGDSVRILGSVAYDQVPGYLSAADLGISHLTENSRLFLQPPIKVLEYLSCSLPVLATDGPGNRFYLKDGQNAVLYPPDGVSGLAAALRSALTNRTAMAGLRQNVRESAVRFDWDHIAEKFVAELQHSLTQPSGRAQDSVAGLEPLASVTAQHAD